MKITKKQLRRMIQEEKLRMAECGEDMATGQVADVVMDPIAVSDSEGSVLESIAPEEGVLVEMELASRTLDQVIESVQNAAQLCPNCVNGIAAQAPMVEALVTQAEALQEMLDAQTDVIQESVSPSDTTVMAVDVIQ